MGELLSSMVKKKREKRKRNTVSVKSYSFAARNFIPL
jgi:hypothetical protein